MAIQFVVEVYDLLTGSGEEELHLEDFEVGDLCLIAALSKGETTTPTGFTSLGGGALQWEGEDVATTFYRVIEPGDGILLWSVLAGVMYSLLRYHDSNGSPLSIDSYSNRFATQGNPLSDSTLTTNTITTTADREMIVTCFYQMATIFAIVTIFLHQRHQLAQCLREML